MHVIIVFQVSLNLGSVKEILKIHCQIYIIMNKGIILWKIQVTMKNFTPTFCNPFSLNLNWNMSLIINIQYWPFQVYIQIINIYGGDLIHMNDLQHYLWLYVFMVAEYDSSKDWNMHSWWDNFKDWINSTNLYRLIYLFTISIINLKWQLKVKEPHLCFTKTTEDKEK